MSELTKCTWERESESAGAMDSCYKLYTWINHTLLMLLFQIIWKFSQISDYIKGKSIQEPKNEMTMTLSPLSKESKYRRHIRSMSDVQSSTPCRIPHRVRKGSNYVLMYDSDTRARRVLSRHRQFDSSDSSDYFEAPMKTRSLGRNIIKHTDSMRIL